MENPAFMPDLRIPQREKLIMAGLYLSKYDSNALKELGFSSFQEAFNIIGFALGSRPASIKNYRDEFDPLFSSTRKGWHKRKTRDYCLAVSERYKEIDFVLFTEIVKSFLIPIPNEHPERLDSNEPESVNSGFAQRLVTGLAAEKYFESKWKDIEQFHGYDIENTTALGCGYDFRLHPKSHNTEFLAIEVKGLRELRGNVSMTPKEHALATALTDRFFLFVVRNFREKPSHDIFRNPLEGHLRFNRIERITVQVSWLANV